MRGWFTSPQNLAGCALGGAGAVLHLVAGAGGVWWPLLVAALYGCGAAARGAPRRRARRAMAPPQGPDLAAVRASLDGVEARSIELDDELALQVRLIVKGLRDLCARIDAGRDAGGDVHVVTRMATEYLPATVGDYLSIPRSQARLRLGSGGRTAFEMAQGQLSILAGQVEEVTEAIVRGDHDRLAAQGRFLESRFATGPLVLPPAEPGGAPRTRG